jgi:polyketide cyclase/dehydrase/lipid transport protein
MNYEMRPPRRGLPSNLSSNLLSPFVRVEYAVFTKAKPELAWKIFSDIESWPKFCSLYKNIRWQGAPWTAGSRLHIEIREPINAIVDRALTVCMPPHHISWISHVRGYTMEQWVSLDPAPGGGTRVATWIEVTGGTVSRDQALDLQQLKSVVSTWFDNFSLECDRAAGVPDDIPSAAD